MAIRVEGLNDAIRSLNRQIKKIPFRTRKGMIAAGLTIQRKAQEMTPVDTANLKASAFTVWKGKNIESRPAFKGKDAGQMKANDQAVIAQSEAGLNPMKNLVPEVEVGFTASYAIFVHEDLEANHKVGQAKFLQKAFSDGVQDAIRSIETEVVIKGTD